VGYRLLSRISGFEYVLKMTKHKCLQEVAKCLHMLTQKSPQNAGKCRKMPENAGKCRKMPENARKTPNLFAHRNATLVAVRNELYKYVNHCISSNDNEW